MYGVKTCFYRDLDTFNDSVDFSINKGPFRRADHAPFAFFLRFFCHCRKSEFERAKHPVLDHLYTAPTKAAGSTKIFLFSGATINVFFMAKKRHHPWFIGEGSFTNTRLVPVRWHRRRDICTSSSSWPKDNWNKRSGEDISADYSLFRQFFMLVNKSWPVIRTVEQAAKHSLSHRHILVDSKDSQARHRWKLSINEWLRDARPCYCIPS